jgi:hypothetical protein
VHALQADGTFRFSYTVAGRVLGSPVVLDDGLVLVASDKNRLYALRPDGSLAWSAFVASGVLAPLERDAADRVWFRTSGGTTIAYSRRGGVVGFAKVGRSMAFGPTAVARDVLVAGRGGELGLIGDFGRYRRASVPGPLRGVWAHESGYLALGSRLLRELDRELGVVWSHPAVDELLCTRPVVVRSEREIRWLAPDGSVRARAAAPALVTRPSACSAASLFAVDSRGGIVQVRSTGESLRLEDARGVVVGLVPLLPGTLVASYQDGRLVALKAAL